MTSPKFRVIIVGGSIAGLSLANFLQKYGIDFVVLEAYDHIAPQVGASIGFHPNGLRLLDQIGCYEDIAKVSSAADRMTTRSSDGRILYSHNVNALLKARHGYEILFMERRSAIKVLYNHVRNKSKVLAGQRVNRIEQDHDRIRVYTKAGDSFEGDIVIGADGIHSFVRREMWRLGNEADPSNFPAASREAMTSLYGCIFGISAPTGDIKSSNVNLTHKKDITIAVMAGPEDMLYWFCFFKLQKPHKGSDLPRFTHEDEVEIAKKQASTIVTEKTTFGDIYKNVKFSTTTPLPHHVFEKWHFGRIYMIGDSVHKFNPISGQGGNNAVESAAAIADNLYTALKANSGKLGPEELEKIFLETQALRHERVAGLVEESITAQRVSAWDTKAFEILDSYIAPQLNTNAIVDQISAPVFEAYYSKIAHDVTQNRAHSNPFADELRSQPASKSNLRLLLTSGYLGLLGLAYYGLCRASNIERALEVLQTEKFAAKDVESLGLKHIPIISSSTTYRIATVLPSFESWDADLKMITFNLAVLTLVIFSTWAVESCRNRNSITPLRLAALLGCIANVSGIAFTTPVVYLLDTLITSTTSAYWPTSTFIPVFKAKAILPALFISMLPPILLLSSTLSSIARQYTVVAWILAPANFYILNRFIRAISLPDDESHVPSKFTVQASESLFHVRALYWPLFLLSTFAHASILSSVLHSHDPQAALFGIFKFGSSQPSSSYEDIQRRFVLEFGIASVAGLLWSFGAVLDLARVGAAQTNGLLVLVFLVAGTLVTGPAAMIAACALWRETKIYRMRKDIEPVKSH